MVIIHFSLIVYPMTPNTSIWIAWLDIMVEHQSDSFVQHFFICVVEDMIIFVLGAWRPQTVLAFSAIFIWTCTIASQDSLRSINTPTTLDGHSVKTVVITVAFSTMPQGQGWWHPNGMLLRWSQSVNRCCSNETDRCSTVTIMWLQAIRIALLGFVGNAIWEFFI